MIILSFLWHNCRRPDRVMNRIHYIIIIIVVVVCGTAAAKRINDCASSAVHTRYNTVEYTLCAYIYIILLYIYDIYKPNLIRNFLGAIVKEIHTHTHKYIQYILCIDGRVQICVCVFFLKRVL